MSNSKAERIVLDTLKDLNGTDDDNINADTHLVDEGYLDSLDSMNFVFKLEKELGIKFAEKDLFDEQFFKVSYISNCIAALKS